MKYGTISTGSIEASLTAEEILKFGGNAFDAAVGAVFVSMTSEFALTGPFGGGVLLGVENNSKPFIYDFFVDCPYNYNPKNQFITTEVDFGNTIQTFNIGRGSIAVPGNIMGLIEVHKKHGSLPLNDILNQAINCANTGVTISSYQSYILKLIEPILEKDKNAKSLFYRNNSLIKENDIFKNHEFGNFLNLIIKNGPEYFYKKEGLKNILTFLGDKSNLDKNDFYDYKVYKRSPISLKFQNHEIYTNPAPAYGGTLIIFLLKLLKDLDEISVFDLIKAMNLSSLARNEICINPDIENEIENVLNEKNFNKYSKLFDNNDSLEFNSKLNGFGSTTHVSILDKKGNAVSITTTNGEGCGYIIPEFGIMMNNMLGEDDLNPFGFHKWRKKRRLPTMVSPTIITENSKIKFVLGSGGSNRIRSANIQVILNLLINKMNLKDAISNPRLHLEGNTLFYEPNIEIPKDKLKNIILNSFNNQNLFFGGVNAVSQTDAIGDNRRGGCGLIV